MVLTPHMLVGAAVGTQAPNVWVAFLFGLISHYLIDVLPHWDYLNKFEITNYKHLIKVFLDLTIGIVLILFLIWFEPQRIIILAAVFGSLLPDFLNGISMNFNSKWLRFHFQIHYKIHFLFFNILSFWQGIFPTIIVSLAAIWVLIL
ncbi:hypothetical protein KKH07_01635 [Patescibacteria group bacterium]|nr:hypothetical protein [Patescibacteria group bacterium]MBU1563887.1 hypothetical protein [Patescibacteria group bacterium]MBU2068537.1 hypothetical protein [Patescibacteria group bacterium]